MRTETWDRTGLHPPLTVCVVQVCVCVCVRSTLPVWGCREGGGRGAGRESCWLGLTERLALREVSPGADSFMGSICLMSPDAGGGAERRGGAERGGGRTERSSF